MLQYLCIAPCAYHPKSNQDHVSKPPGQVWRSVVTRCLCIYTHEAELCRLAFAPCAERTGMSYRGAQVSAGRVAQWAAFTALTATELALELAGLAGGKAALFLVLY